MLFKEIIRFTDDILVFNWVVQYVGSTELGWSMYLTDFDGVGYIDDNMPKQKHPLGAITFSVLNRPVRPK